MDYLDRVLELINKARTADGHDPLPAIPAGPPCDSYSCPLGQALRPLERTVYGTPLGAYGLIGRAELNGYLTTIEANELAEFPLAFDRGEFPELVEKG